MDIFLVDHLIPAADPMWAGPLPLDLGPTPLMCNQQRCQNVHVEFGLNPEQAIEHVPGDREANAIACGMNWILSISPVVPVAITVQRIARVGRTE
ncbi:hypothetical protein HK100_007972, partial [Physocladia obscura]